ncbi:hypothetical protein NQ317_017291 [Molorchus minor]|uniref:Uncharacterized protein n=1 Tax=Molorchus minor TaxID=1323400 RepID=A0ABQ9JTL2_9CUCU|nr:hypothetical protein NQ317_017291 [Molorchus minor]
MAPRQKIQIIWMMLQRDLRKYPKLMKYCQMIRREGYMTSTVKMVYSMEAVEEGIVMMKILMVLVVSDFSASEIPRMSLGEFFSGTVLFDLLHDLPTRDRSRRNRHSHPQNALSTTSLFSPFGLSLGGSLMDDFFNTGSSGFTSFSTINNSFGASSPGGANVKRTSTSTRFVNGKKITTKKVFDNGKETVMTYENDVLKSKTVNGIRKV